VRAAVVQGDATLASFRPTEQGLSGRSDRLVEVQPADRLISYIPKGLPLEPVQSWVPVVSARVRSEHAGGRRLRRQQGGRSAAGRKLQPGGAQQSDDQHPARVAAADFKFRRHHLRLQRRQVAVQGVPGQVRMADGDRRSRSSVR
jgi:hypothetical protein